MKLQWIDDRWHCDGRGIHAGDRMELRCDGGKWLAVRVESCNRGSGLSAIIEVEGREFASTIEPEYDDLRWTGELRWFN